MAEVEWFAHPDANRTFIVMDTYGNLIALNVTESEAHKVAAAREMFDTLAAMVQDGANGHPDCVCEYWDRIVPVLTKARGAGCPQDAHVMQKASWHLLRCKLCGLEEVSL